MDLGAVLESIVKKEAIEGAKIDTMSKLKNDRTTVDKMSQGKTTLAGLFKGKAGKASYTQTLLTDIQQSERDVINYDIIKNYLIIYLVEIVIPYWKHSKVRNYLRAMSFFSKEEVSNAQKHEECWSQFIEVIKKVDFK